MKNLVVAFVFACFTSMGFAQDKGVDITVTIDNVANDEGKVLITLHPGHLYEGGWCGQFREHH